MRRVNLLSWWRLLEGRGGWRAFWGWALLSQSALASAQTRITDVEVREVSYSLAQVVFRLESPVSESTDAWIEYGATRELGMRTNKWRSTGGGALRSILVGGLAPETRYHFQPVLALASGEEVDTWSCGEQAGPARGYLCGADGEPPSFQTEAAPSERPVKPVAPRRISTSIPEINGRSFVVQTDDAGACLDLQAQLDAAAAADSSQNHEVVIPAGADCIGTHTLPRKSGPGTVLVRTSTPLVALPPDGERVQPSDAPLLARISAPAEAAGYRDGGEAVRTLLRCTSPCTEGWYFLGLEFTHEPHTAAAPRVFDIVDVERDSGIIITTDRPHGLTTHQQVMVADVAGMSQLNGPAPVVTLGERKLRLGVGQASGSWVPGTGYLVYGPSIPIEDCTNSSPVVCTTAERHGLTADPEIRILRVSEGLATLEEPMRLSSEDGVEVFGSPDRTNDGLWTVRSRDGGRTLDLGDEIRDCDADCGWAARRQAVQIAGVEGNAAANGSHVFRVRSDREVELPGTVGSGPYEGGGFLTLDPDSFFKLVAVEGSRRIVFDRCYFHGQGFPTRLAIGLALGADDSAVINSYFGNINSWRPIHPISGVFGSASHGLNHGTSNGIVLSDGVGVKISNDEIRDCAGISFFVPASRPDDRMTPADVEISQNVFALSDRLRAGSASSDGRYYPVRHLLEFKRGVRTTIDGNLFEGGWADVTPSGNAVLLSVRAGSIPGNRLSDFSIVNNVFRANASGIQIIAEDTSKDRATLPTQRFEISNNLFDRLNFYDKRSAPSAVNGPRPSENFGGWVLRVDGVMEDLIVTRNTSYDNRGKGPLFFSFDGGRSSSVVVTDNLITHHADNSYGGVTSSLLLRRFDSSIQGPAAEVFDAYFTAGYRPDPISTFARNVVVPGVKDSSSAANLTSAATKVNFTRSDCEEFYRGFSQIACIGSGGAGDTAAQRLASVFGDPPRLSSPSIPFDAGADVDGPISTGVTNLSVKATSDPRSYELKFSATTGPCIISYSSDAALDQGLTATVPGTGPEYALVLSGLIVGARYSFQLTCPPNEIAGEFVVSHAPVRTRTRSR